MDGNVIGLLDDRAGLEGDAEVFVLDLRDGGGGGVTEDLIEEICGGNAIDGDALESAGGGGALEGEGGGSYGVAAADAEGGGLVVADTELNVVERAGVAGVEREVEGGVDVGGNACGGEATAEESDGAAEQACSERGRRR